MLWCQLIFSKVYLSRHSIAAFSPYRERKLQIHTSLLGQLASGHYRPDAEEKDMSHVMETQPSSHHRRGGHVCGRCRSDKVERREMSKRGVICVFFFCGRAAPCWHLNKVALQLAPLFTAQQDTYPPCWISFFFPFSSLTVVLSFTQCPTRALVEMRRLHDSVMLLFLCWRILLPRTTHRVVRNARHWTVALKHWHFWSMHI